MHTEPPADAVIFVLVDACRHDYVSRTRFLSGLASLSLTGRLEEPFGFCPRGAYFGGLTMAEQGYTNLYRFDPENSVYRWTRHLAGSRKDAVVRERLVTDIGAHARALATPFTASYLNPLEIPLEWLAYFDASEQEGPASRRVGYRSLFHVLEDAHQSWVDVSWPFPGWRGPLTSARVAGLALDRWSYGDRFIFIHLPDLDAIGHQFGPGSTELQVALEETDRLCEHITHRALELHDDPVVVFAGDHGMLPVVRPVNVAQALAETGLRVGHDFVYFIDSTMVRCWFFTNGARHRAWSALEAVGGGHVITADERRRWGLAGIDPRSGEDIFLADPGVLFSPNFFDWSGSRPARGMHGYAPEIADNQAMWLAHWPRRKRVGHVGTVQARQLYPTFLEWLGFEASTFTAAPAIRVQPEAPTRGRWSVNGTPDSDRVVEGHLAHVVRRVRERAPEVEAIVLAGGFGRGEGTLEGEGALARPVNDYDLVVVGGRDAAYAGLGAELAGELGIDFVELWPRPVLEAPTAPSQFDFDLRYASRVLWGDPLIVDRWPRAAPATVSVEEGIAQIGNRCGGCLLALTALAGEPEFSDPFLSRQTSKFLIAVADCWLMSLGDYHPSYVIRRRRFADLSTGLFSLRVRQAIDAAFARKLTGSSEHRGCATTQVNRVETRPAATIAARGIGTETIVAQATAPTAAQTLSAQPFSAEAMVAEATAALDELEQVLHWSAGPSALDRQLSTIAPRRIRTSTDWLGPAADRGLLVRDEFRHDGAACVGAVYRACLTAVRHWPHGVSACAERVTAALRPQFAAVADGSHVLSATARTWLAFTH